MAKDRIPGAPPIEPWRPTNWEIEDAGAIQAVAYGKASEHQQQRAIKFIVENICGCYDLSFRSGDPHTTTFAEGKRFVALQLIKFVNMNIPAIQGKPSEQR